MHFLLETISLKWYLTIGRLHPDVGAGILIPICRPFLFAWYIWKAFSMWNKISIIYISFKLLFLHCLLHQQEIVITPCKISFCYVCIFVDFRDQKNCVKLIPCNVPWKHQNMFYGKVFIVCKFITAQDIFCRPPLKPSRLWTSNHNSSVTVVISSHSWSASFLIEQPLSINPFEGPYS